MNFAAVVQVFVCTSERQTGKPPLKPPPESGLTAAREADSPFALEIRKDRTPASLCKLANSESNKSLPPVSTALSL